MMHTKGSLLLEMLVAIMIATFVGSALFAAYYQINKAMSLMENNIDLHTRMITMSNQLTQDFSGACIPYNNAQKETKKNQEDEKKLTHIFYATTQESPERANQNIKLITFITNNPLRPYWDGTIGRGKPYLARVVYRLEADPTDTKTMQRTFAQHDRTKAPDTTIVSYTLIRDEFDDPSYNPTALKKIADLQDYQEGYQDGSSGTALEGVSSQVVKSHTSFIVARGIKQCSMSYGVRTIQKQESSKGKKTAQKRGSFVTLNEWNQEESESKETKESELPKIPEVIFCTVTLWNATRVGEKTGTMTIPIITDFTPLENWDSPEKKSEKNEHNKSDSTNSVIDRASENIRKNFINTTRASQ